MPEHNNLFAAQLNKLIDEWTQKLTKQKDPNDLMSYSMHAFQSRRRISTEIYTYFYENDYKTDGLDLPKLIKESVEYSRISTEEMSDSECKNLADFLVEGLK